MQDEGGALDRRVSVLAEIVFPGELGPVRAGPEGLQVRQYRLQLLCAAGLLITDYSSSMFDYALTGKPIVQYATDIDAYQKGRDFYFSLDSLPFPLARSNEELETILTDLQPLWTSPAWAEFSREHEFCEDGQASVRCAALILQQMKKENGK